MQEPGMMLGAGVKVLNIHSSECSQKSVCVGGTL